MVYKPHPLGPNYPGPKSSRRPHRRRRSSSSAGAASPTGWTGARSIFTRDILTARRARTARDIIGKLLAHRGVGFAVHDVSQSHVDTYAAARRSGSTCPTSISCALAGGVTSRRWRARISSRIRLRRSG